jgi:hypothetical protein
MTIISTMSAPNVTTDPPERDVVSTNCEQLGRDGPPAGDDRPGEFDAVSHSDRFLHLQSLVLPPDESRVQHYDVAIEVAVVDGRGPRLERSRRIVDDQVDGRTDFGFVSSS